MPPPHQPLICLVLLYLTLHTSLSSPSAATSLSSEIPPSIKTTNISPTHTNNNNNNDDTHIHSDFNNHNHTNHSDNHTSHSNHEHHSIHVASIHFDYVKQPFILSIFLIVVVLAKIGFHYANFLSSWMPESCVLIILGVVVGGLLHVLKVDTSSFYYIDPPFFFLFLLPPCILEASYGLHDQVFFQNLGTIMVYAIVGTMLNFFLVGSILFGLAYVGAMGSISISLIQCLVFSSLIVAVDPVAVLAIFQEIGVNNVLYFVVFGESLLNDAVTVVLYNTIITLSKMDGKIPASEIGMAVAAFFTVSVGGLCIGIIFGVLTALVTKHTLHVRMMEPLAILSLSYASYLTAELFHFSGIISLIGCGLIQMQYAFHNISNNSSITIKYFAKMLSGACDCIIFMFLGIALVRDNMVWHPGFILWSVVLCLVIRFLVTYTLTFILNKTERKRRIGTKEQFIMAYGGLRGAVAFCLVALLEPSEHKDLFRTTTLVIIFFTVFFQGITIKPLVKCLKIKGEEEKIVSLYQEINSHVMDHLLLYIEELIGNYGYNSIQGFLNNLNDNYLKKLLQREPFTKDEIIMELYQQIALQQHYESVYGMDTSSQMHLYKPELISRPSIAYDSTMISLQAEQLSRRLSMEASRKEENVLRPAARKFRDVAFAVTPKRRKPSVRSESESKSPVSKWQAASRKIGGRMSIFSADASPPPETLDLRKMLTQSSQKDVFARHSARNQADGEKSDLLLLLNEKQLRHSRFKARLSQASTPGLSRAESLDHEEAGHRRARAAINKHKTVDFSDKPNIENKFVARFLSKRPVNSNNAPTPPKTPPELAELMPLKEEGDRRSSPAKEEPTEPSSPSYPSTPHSAPQSPYKALYQSPVSHSAQPSPQHKLHYPHHYPTKKQTSQSPSPPPSNSQTASPAQESDRQKTSKKRESFKRQNAANPHLQDTHEDCL